MTLEQATEKIEFLIKLNDANLVQFNIINKLTGLLGKRIDMANERIDIVRDKITAEKVLNDIDKEPE